MPLQTLIVLHLHHVDQEQQQHVDQQQHVATQEIHLATFLQMSQVVMCHPSCYSPARSNQLQRQLVLVASAAS